MLYKEAEQKKKSLEKQTGKEHVLYHLIFEDMTSTYCVTSKETFTRLTGNKTPIGT